MDTVPFDIWILIFRRLLTLLPISLTCRELHTFVNQYLTLDKPSFTGVILAKAIGVQCRSCSLDYVYSLAYSTDLKSARKYKEWYKSIGLKKKTLSSGLALSTLLTDLLGSGNPANFIFATCEYPEDIISGIFTQWNFVKDLVAQSNPIIIAIICMMLDNKKKKSEFVKQIFKTRDILIIEKLLPMLVASNFDIQNAAIDSPEMFKLVIREGCLIKQSMTVLRAARHPELPRESSLVAKRLGRIRGFIYNEMKRLRVYRAKWGQQTFAPITAFKKK